jgi:aspartyl-tRNA(Asn)/glutamyl-tRNA(Gln) amidotransferase subunit B
MEEDAGKLIHDEWEDCSLVDYNRSGVPLIEIVSEPDMRSAEEVIAYLEKLRFMMQYLGVSDCKLQEGSMRADVNLSVREVGSETFGTRTEMKNLNSFKAIARAIEGERERQIELLEMGKPVVQETRRWDDNKESSHAMRSKEDAKDYRYFPDPDLPPVHISAAWLKAIHENQPELRDARIERYKKEYELSDYDAGILTESRNLSELFEETARLCGNPKKAANWFLGEVLRMVKEKGADPATLSFTPKHLADLIVMVEKKEVSAQNAKRVFERIFEEDVDPCLYIEEHGLKIVEDADLLKTTLARILDENPGPLGELIGGKEKVFGFFVGLVMKELKGKARPDAVREALTQAVEERKK